ncbi:DUF4822 domain-containing protein [Tsukamurella sp. 1534]|uniref:DUF4822 domain-containing protein n=1 Tax=Tsukamurella sp. 1534 TaxID=1151061 RepID=UPI0002F7D86B|nr:DUF4822 domain-containing protein [Tsukamurella sp. 1534]
MHKNMKIASMTAVAAALVATSACAAGSYATPGSPASSSAAASSSAKASSASSAKSSAPSSKPASANPTPVRAGTPSAVLAATAWETTAAKDEKGASVKLGDDAVKNYVGNAYYKKDGTFTMYTLDDKPKMRGVWSVSADGKSRTLTAKDKAGKVQFTRKVEITKLTAQEFTYRVYPKAEDKTKYYDIVHTPTKHAEPRA